MIIELHSLTSHAPANLNRDDLGRPKSAKFGGSQRARISSQAIKRSIRTSNYLEDLVKGRISTRSRRLPENIFNELSKELGENSKERLEKLCQVFTEVVGKPDKNPLHTKQIVFLTPKEIAKIKEHIRGLALGAGKLGKKEVDEIKSAMPEEVGLNRNPGDGIDLAMFGRMTTDEANSFASVDAALQVAHAISTHTVVPEVDWFTAVDDIVTGESETGSGHLGETEFNAAVFYKYFSCNLPLLVRNLGNDATVAIDALAAVFDASCRVTPSGKQNSFASHSLADTVLVVIRKERVPVSLANAFENPVRSQDGDGERGFLSRSRELMANHYADLQGGYGLNDVALCFNSSEQERSHLATILPQNAQMFTSLSALFAAMKMHAQGMLPAGAGMNGTPVAEKVGA